jgi:hypothetical protein
MVRLAGLEPAITVFSSLLIVTFGCTYLQVLIRQFASDCKDYYAGMGNNEKEKLCQIVSRNRLCQSCVWPDSVPTLCQLDPGVLPPELRFVSDLAASCDQCVRRAGMFIRFTALASWRSPAEAPLDPGKHPRVFLSSAEQTRLYGFRPICKKPRNSLRTGKFTIFGIPRQLFWPQLAPDAFCLTTWCLDILR